MCGIAGSAGTILSREWAGYADRRLARRGPDGMGGWYAFTAGERSGTPFNTLPGTEMKEEDGIFFLHRRLAIIDIAGGVQPFYGGSPDAPVVMTVNGEIYNYRELRRELQESGHTFSSSSDSEVILHGYEKWGSRVFEHLNGMFACAIYDSLAQKLILARDPFGKKPLYYAMTAGNGIVFASTLPVLTAHPAVKAEVGMERICDFLETWYVPGSNTIYRNIFKIPPGSVAEYTLNDRKTVIRKYFHLDFSRKSSFSRAEAEDEFLTLFSEACRKRMQADVPAGTFLSGGMDSLAVTAMLLDSGFRSLDVATIGFANSEYNELPAAEESAVHLRNAGLDSFNHRVRIVQGDDLNMLKMLWREFGEPFGDASLLPTGALCSFTAERCKCALSGDGADELFAGYERCRAMEISRRLTGWGGKASEFFAGRLAMLAAMLLPGGMERSRTGRLRRFMQTLAHGAGTEAYAFLMSKASPVLLRQCAGPVLLDAFSERQRANAGLAGMFAALEPELTTSVPGERWCETDIMTYLPGDILPKVDTASMSFALEVRSPFLDLELAKFSAKLPWEYKVNNGRGKAVIAGAMGRKFPFMTQKRRKRGFGVPLADFLAGSWQSEAVRALSSPLLTEMGMITPKGKTVLLNRSDKEAMDLKWSFIVLANFLESREI